MRASGSRKTGFHTDGNLKMELARAHAARLALLGLLAEAHKAEGPSAGTTERSG